MSQPTDEMVRELERAWTAGSLAGGLAAGWRAGAAAVLAIAERDRQAAAEAPRWRCNRTERCFREDGHHGPHAFAGTSDQEASDTGSYPSDGGSA